MLSAIIHYRQGDDMKNKVNAALLSMMFIVCLQTPISVNAVELPFVPIEESQTVTTDTNNSIPMENLSVSEKTTTNKTEIPKTTNKADNLPVAAESENNNLPVLAPDGDETEIIESSVSNVVETSENKVSSETTTIISSSEISVSTVSNTIQSTEINTETNTINNELSGKKSNIGVIVASIGGAVLLAGIVFAIFRKGKK